MMRVLLLLIFAPIISLISYNSSYAGWFGPSNYPECVMDEMKGKPLAMKDVAERICDLKFPCKVYDDKDKLAKIQAQCEAEANQKNFSEDVKKTFMRFCVGGEIDKACNR